MKKWLEIYTNFEILKGEFSFYYEFNKNIKNLA